MGRRSRECYLCGAKYEYCPTCTQDKMKPTWMAEFHSENCKTIFEICTRFNMKLITKTEAKAALKECDLSNKANFKECVKRDLSVILKEDPKPKRTKKPESIVLEPAVEETELHEVVINKEEE